MTKKEKEKFLNELNSFGYNFKTFDDVMRIGKKDKILIPTLLKWIENPKDDSSDIAWIARCLTVKGYTEATETLLRVYRKLPVDVRSDKWVLGNAIGVISDKRYIDEYIEIILDKKNGRSRQMLIYEMGAFKEEEKVKKALLSLLDDDSVNGHAIYALSKFKDRSLIEKIKPFLEDEKTWKRNEAKKAIKKLEKLES